MGERQREGGREGRRQRERGRERGSERERGREGGKQGERGWGGWGEGEKGLYTRQHGVNSLLFILGICFVLCMNETSKHYSI